MQLSIIIPTLNEEPQIAQAVNHAWGLAPKEVIVADGGSTDDTVAIAQQHKALVVSCQPSRGAQLNLGTKHAAGDVFLFLHADTWLPPAAREQMKHVLTKHALQNPATTFGAFYQQIEAKGGLYRWLERGNAYRVRKWGLAYGDQGMFVRREIFEQVGGFSNLPVMEDLWFSRKMRTDHRPVLLPGPLHVSARRWQQQGVIRQTARNWSLIIAERCGVAPEKLVRLYQPQVMQPTQTASA